MLMTRIDTWLATRRASGFALEGYERHLHRFAEFAAARGDDHVRAKTAIAWALQKTTPGQRERHYLEVLVHGKGRKERALLLWKEVGDAIRGAAACLELFLTAVAQPMTRSGFAYILRKHVRVARVTCPSLVDRSVSPHVLRHTCALDTLRATGDLRKVSLWLGHAQQSTTEIYLQVDPTEKIEILESVIPPRLRPGKFRPQDRLIASLTPAKAPPPSALMTRVAQDYAESRTPDTAPAR